MMAKWCIDTLNELGEDLVKNSWRNGEYSYFPDEATTHTALEEFDPSLDEEMVDLEEAEAAIGETIML